MKQIAELSLQRTLASLNASGQFGTENGYSAFTAIRMTLSIGKARRGYADLSILSAFSIAAERRNSDFRIPHAAAALSMRSAPVFGHLKDRFALASTSESLRTCARRCGGSPAPL